MPLVVIGLSHRTSPVELRERFAFGDADIPTILSSLRTGGLAEEGVIISTCNRVEIYVATSQEPKDAIQRLREFLIANSRFEGPLAGEIYGLAEPESVEHLFRVVSGLDSMVLGETEILGQVKRFYELALQNRLTGAVLNRIFQKAFNVAKQIRTETNIQRGSISVASVAVELAGKIFDTLADRTVMVVGAGDTGEKTARALLSRGASRLLVTNRSPARAEMVAGELGGKAIPFDDWTGHFETVDIAICSTAAPNHVIDRSRLAPLMRQRKFRPLLLIDIAVPRDVDPAVNEIENVYLYNVDDLQAIADGYLQQRREEIARCELIVQERAAEWVRAPRRPAAIPTPSAAQGRF